MKFISKKWKKIFIISTIILIIAILSTLIAKHVDNQYAKLDSETLRAMNYEQIKDTGNYVNYINEDGTIGNECNFIEFSAFFTRDLDGDGYAERLNGTCKNLSDTDTLYAEVNVLTKGHLEDGKITLNANNFKWKTAIVSDNIVEGDYIGETSEIKLKSQVQNGSQKLLWGTISQNIGNNINNYSKISSMTLTGTYVDDDGNKTKIQKNVDLTVDWYGTTETSVNRYYYNNNGYSSYDNQLLDISNIVTENGIELNFRAAISETNKTLLLQKQVAELSIPNLNGYKPTLVTVLDKSVEYNYNEETSKLTIIRSSIVDEESGKLISSISRNNINNIKIQYPLEAYDQASADSIVLNIPIVGYNYGYNNPNEEFENPHISSAEGVFTVTYSKPSGNIWNIDVTVGNQEQMDLSYKYEVSKEAVANIYNGNKYEDNITTYPVKWEVVIGDYTAIQKLTLQEQQENGGNKSDQFLNTSGIYTSMYDYIKTTGVYFTNASNVLGEQGWIKLYNAETGSLIETFTSANWYNYTKGKPYSVDVKSIKIETSNPIANTTFNVYQIKEMDDEKVSQSFTESEFNKLQYIYTYLQGTIEAPEDITYENGEKISQINKSGYAYYDMPYSIAEITMTPNQITNQKTENVELSINTISVSEFEKKWKNGIFLIELPEDIINVEIKSITSSNDNIEISAYEVVENEGKKFIKIYTLNEKEAIYTIKINADIAANPLKPTETQNLKLYSYNENGDNYYDKIQDQYDVDSDGQTTDYVGFSKTTMSLIAPSGLLTTEYITNYDDHGNTTIAPNIADIEKSTEKRTATINVSITNGYNGTISDVIILGKIPFEGNTYVLNGGELNSQFTANIKNEIKIPEKLKEYTTIYYSTNENATNNIDDKANDWKIAKDITDWSKIKTYLIDLTKYTLTKTENEVFSYEVEVPAGLGYNTVSYSDHAVYYNLDTEEGKLSTQTEPNKVGIQVVSKYSLQLTKNKKANNTTFVKGATYSITTTDQDGKEIVKTATTDKNGILKFSGMYVEKIYTLKEVSTPKDYILNDSKVKFIAKINEQEKLDVEIQEGNFKNGTQITTDENGNYLVTAEVEDEAKYTLLINKTNENGEKLKEVKFKLNENEKISKTYKTDKNGVIEISGLYPDVEYELQEIKSDGYYVDLTPRKFIITRNDDGKLEVISEDTDLKNATINETQESAQAKVNVNIQNEKIPTYNLQILKIEENDGKNEKITALSGASFKLFSTDLQKQKEYTTDENGYINISDLYAYVEGKNITGKYTLQETKSPEGYSNNAEEIDFKVTKNEDNTLSINVENQDDLTTIKSATVEENTIKIVVQDKPIFRIKKIDSETGKELANAKFIIYEIDENAEVIDYAKDVNENYVGEKNQQGEYIVTTNENGIIALPLRGGTYKIVEVGYPDGYTENSVVEIFKVNKKENIEDTTETIEINYIEDLVKLSNEVNAGNSYAGKTVKLMRTLDFNDESSYKNPNDISFGDLNGNNDTEGIKDELTNKNGCGFTPIGNGIKRFSGTFNGQRYEIKNIYININKIDQPSMESYVGLFGNVDNGTIKNIGVTGKINFNKMINATGSFSGGIIGYAYKCDISNCYNMCEINSVSINYINYTGGIVGEIVGGSINDCYNTGDINSKGQDSEVGGISGSSATKIINCYNLGSITSSNDTKGSASVAGITGSGCGNIYNCYNIGDISCNNSSYYYNYVGGIIGEMKEGKTEINNCYNNANISINSSESGNLNNAGGIAGAKQRYREVNTIINNCYNTGNVYNNVNSEENGCYAGTIVGDSSVKTNNCYYLESINIAGISIGINGIPASEKHMKSIEFCNELNTDNVWKYKNNEYPILISIADIVESTELTIQNTIKKFKITTDVLEVNGVKGGTITGEDEEPYETVKIHEDNKNQITMTPDSGYTISNITINGKNIPYEVKEDGTYTILPGYFEDMQEDKHIVVTYESLDRLLIINKVDENDNSKVLEGAKFKIDKDEELYGEFTTNEYGQIRISVPAGAVLCITEVEAPKGYILNSDKITYEMKSDGENTITITNKHKATLTVHHYLKQEDGTYTNLKVAEDEKQEGNIGEKYVTSPKIDLEGLELEKIDGEYIIPTNATGTYSENPIEVTYYYEVKPINLTINHYIDGTDIKLADEKNEKFNSEILFNEDGSYKITTQGTYKIDTNYDYKNLIKTYELVRIESSSVPTLDSNDTLKFTENSELRYYYQLKDHIITTEVKEHIENRTNSLTNIKEEIKVKGGTITGEDQSPYEIVEDGKDSTKEIIATPDEGYTIKQIILQSTNNDGEKTETIVYGKNEDKSAEISYIKNLDGSIKLNGVNSETSGEQLFTNVTENKHIIVEFEPAMGTVIVHHYIEGTGEEYGNTAVKVPSKDGKVVENEVKNDYVGEVYSTKESNNVANVYELKSVSGKISGRYINGELNVYYYYNYRSYNYSIHYYYDGVEKVSNAITDQKATYGTVITDYPDKAEGYVFEKVTPVGDGNKTKLTITENEEQNRINVYYRSQFKITTDVIEHSEVYKNGDKKESVKGGEISGEDKASYEKVFKGDIPQKEIKITPSRTTDDQGNTVEYEVVKIVIKNSKDDTTGVEVDITKLSKEDDGSVILPKEYLTDGNNGMQSDKHIEVEFRKKSNVIIKYLEKGTENVLYKTSDGKDYEEITGYEGEHFETSRKAITNYKTAESNSITDDIKEAMNKYNGVETNDKTYVNGTMYADTLTIIYWYEKISSGIIVKHIEIDESDIKDGLTLSKGKILDEETISGYVGETIKTSRKNYENMIFVNGPETKEENIVIISKDENNKDVICKQNEVVEVRYYYEKQYNVTTEVKPHDEKIFNNQTNEYETKKVDGGTISKEYITSEDGSKVETIYEKINKMGYNKKQIEISPDKGYRIKEITINGIKYDLNQLEKDGEKVIIKSGTDNSSETAFFKDVNEDKHVVVEFERIPAKVIVEYKDAYTKENIDKIDTKIINGFVNDDYNETRPDIEGYVPADPEPTNNKGKMTEDDITVIYWYNKEFKITTDVIEIKLVDKDGNILVKKGGTITGEDEMPYESVIRGNNNTKAIDIIPDYGFEIKQIKINGVSIDYINDDNMTKDGKNVRIPEEYFKNMQEDKHIEVEFKRIPGKVIVKNLEDETDKPLTEDTTESGYIGEKYKTQPSNIKYYELVEEKYPNNSEGELSEEETVVIYYYKKVKFNFKIEKDISKIIVNNEEKTIESGMPIITLQYKNVSNTIIKVEYKIKVTNTEKLAGKAIIEENIPDGFEFAEENADEWNLVDGKYVLETELINPGESKEYVVVLKWKNDTQNKGKKVNNVKIIDTQNEANFDETTLEDNEDNAVVELKIDKTVNDVIDDIKNGNSKEIIRDIKTAIKTGDTIIVSFVVLAVSTISLIIIVKRKSKK